MAVSATLAPRLYVGSFNWTTAANQIDVGATMATQDATTFEFAEGGFTNAVAGLKTFEFNATGLQDYDGATSFDAWLRANWGSYHALSCAYLGSATGNACIIGYGQMGGYRPFNAQVGAVPTTVGTLTGGRFGEGQVTAVASSAISSTGNSTPVQLGAISASQSVYAAIHVVAASGSTPSLTPRIQSASTSGGSYTNRGSAGSALADVGEQWLSTNLGSAVTDTWWRLSWTVSGSTPSFSVFAALAII